MSEKKYLKVKKNTRSFEENINTLPVELHLSIVGYFINTTSDIENYLGLISNVDTKY